MSVTLPDLQTSVAGEEDPGAGSELDGPTAPDGPTSRGKPGPGEKTCPDCGGGGVRAGRECPACAGTGRVTMVGGAS